MIRDVQQLEKGPFDLLVIGGGIYGAWTAYDAALRGLKVALVEKSDWSSGTSSASSKLIHGGLRYLEQFKFGLVKKSLEERKRLTDLAPHRVAPLRFLIPVYRDSPVGPLRLRAGLVLYDLLAGKNQPVEGHRWLSRSKVLQTYPFLKAEGLKAGLTYGDCQMDDFRFCLEVIAGANRAGAVTANYAEATELLFEGDRVAGARIKDCLGNRRLEVAASVVVNTAGPWIGQIGGGPSREQMVRLTKGVHLVMPPLPTLDALLLMVKRDERIFFIIPWYGRTLIGTTDTDYSGSPDDVKVEEEDIDYLLTEANRIFRKKMWDTSSVCGSFAGLRALINEPDKSPSAVTREWSMAEPCERLLVSVGGKYTSARSDAATLVDRVMVLLGKPFPKESPTQERPFPWSPGEPFSLWKAGTLEKSLRLGLQEETAEWLLSRYGTTIDAIHQYVRKQPELADPLVSGLPFSKAEILHGAAGEMAFHLEDLLRRRVPVLIMTRVTREVLEEAAALAAPVLGWNSGMCREEVNSTARKWGIS
jgi:glycerol-3-phosphate dehydrogenase